MNRARLLSGLLAASLLLANLVCACGLSEEIGSAKTGHHGSSGDHGDAAVMPCAHHDCGGCDELRDSCESPGYTLVSADRDARFAASVQGDSEDPDLYWADTGSDPPSLPLLAGVDPPPGTAATARPDTPVDRKDRLIE